MGKKVANPMADLPLPDELMSGGGKKKKPRTYSAAEAENPLHQGASAAVILATCGLFFFILILVNIAVMGSLEKDVDNTPPPPVATQGTAGSSSAGILNGMGGAGESRRCGGGGCSVAAASGAATEQEFHDDLDVTGYTGFQDGSAPSDLEVAATQGITEETAACMRANTCSAIFFENSDIIGPYAVAINEWISTRYGTVLDRNVAKNQHWVRCFSTFQHGHAHPQDFHALCDQYAKTVTIARNSAGFLFGGYADRSWNRCPEGDACYGGYDQSATRNFIFGLSETLANGTVIHQPTMHAPNGANNYYQADSPNIWPTWGRGADLSVGMLSVPGVEAYCDQLGPGGTGHTYGARRKETCGAGLSQWGQTDLEVWRRVDEDPTSGR